MFEKLTDFLKRKYFNIENHGYKEGQEITIDHKWYIVKHVNDNFRFSAIPKTDLEADECSHGMPFRYACEECEGVSLASE